MRISFYGAAREVGRSAFLLETEKSRILLDYGIKLTGGEVDSFPEDVAITGPAFPAEIEGNLDAVIISHAHLDHSGSLPHLFKNKMSLAYMTPPTLELSRMLWFDTIKIAKKNQEISRFSSDDVSNLTRFTFPLLYNREVPINKEMSLEFFDAGHILGGAITKLNIGEKSLLYTGDFKATETRLFKGADLNVGKVDYLITESTYGDHDHKPRKEVEKDFVDSVQDTVDRGGFVLCPAFAIGRSQEIVQILFEYGVQADIYLDGMGQKAAQIFMNNPDYLKDSKRLKKALESMIWVKDKKTRKIASQKPGVIVTTAGMLKGGPVMYYLSKLYKDKNSSVYLTGYQVQGTPGRMLMEDGRIPIEDKGITDVKMEVKHFDFSAHSDQSDLLYSIKKWAPEKVFLVHGDLEKMTALKEKLKNDLGMDAVMPELNETISINKK